MKILLMTSFMGLERSEKDISKKITKAALKGTELSLSNTHKTLRKQSKSSMGLHLMEEKYSLDTTKMMLNPKSPSLTYKIEITEPTEVGAIEMTEAKEEKEVLEAIEA